jgi:Protein of unknown function (DUF742)
VNEERQDPGPRPPDPRMIPPAPPPPRVAGPHATDRWRPRARHVESQTGATGETPRSATGETPRSATGEIPVGDRTGPQYGGRAGSQYGGRAEVPTRDEVPAGMDDLVVRPFLLTGGRTRPGQDGLRVETLIQAQAGVPLASLRFEARRIVELCQRPISIAEVAASCRVPIGVARVLVSDLVADGSVALVAREALSVQLLKRIRDRVRAL